jgi:predicted 3-demethylubiquinone-9 3-methyltransferase (glyoxalase superfamily)
MKAAFSIAGQTVQCTDSVVKHEFTFTPAISFFIDCESEEDIQRLSSALSKAGLSSCRWANMASAVSSPGSGISWQLNLD